MRSSHLQPAGGSWRVTRKREEEVQPGCCHVRAAADDQAAAPPSRRQLAGQSQPSPVAQAQVHGAEGQGHHHDPGGQDSPGRAAARYLFRGRPIAASATTACLASHPHGRPAPRLAYLAVICGYTTVCWWCASILAAGASSAGPCCAPAADPQHTPPRASPPDRGSTTLTRVVPGLPVTPGRPGFRARFPVTVSTIGVPPRPRSVPDEAKRDQGEEVTK